MGCRLLRKENADGSKAGIDLNNVRPGMTDSQSAPSSSESDQPADNQRQSCIPYIDSLWFCYSTSLLLQATCNSFSKPSKD